MNLKKFLAEMKRRNVWKAAMAYVIASWVILQVLAVLTPAFDADHLIKWAFYFLLLAFPCWLVFSWIYEITHEGLKKTTAITPEDSIAPKTGNRFNRNIIGALGVAIVLLIINMLREPTASALEPETTEFGLLPPDSLEQEKSIAVLAFADMSPQKDQEYFSDGISEEILNLLAQIPELKVVSRTSSFSFKGQNATTEEIGEILKVNHILEGSVRKSGNTLRITAQLINVADGAHLWSKAYDRNMADIFSIQDEIATEVTRELKAKLMNEPIKSKEVDTEAYTTFLQARQVAEQFTSEATYSAAELLKKSIAIDSTYAPAWALLSRVYSRLSFNFLTMPREEAFSKGLLAANKAIALDPDYALAYAYLAILQTGNFDFPNAAENIEKALELEPNNADVLSNSYIFNMVSREEKIKAMKRALSISPLEYRINFNLAIYQYCDNHLEEARESLNIYSLHFPNAAVQHYLRGRIYYSEGDYEAAYQEMLKEEDEFFRKQGIVITLYGLGRHQEADKLLSEFMEAFPNEATGIADIFAGKGDKDQAFKWLDKALEEKDPTLTEGLYYPVFEILYNDPRWNDFINRINLPEGHGVPMGTIS